MLKDVIIQAVIIKNGFLQNFACEGDSTVLQLQGVIISVNSLATLSQNEFRLHIIKIYTKLVTNEAKLLNLC